MIPQPLAGVGYDARQDGGRCYFNSKDARNIEGAIRTKSILAAAWSADSVPDKAGASDLRLSPGRAR